MSFSCKYTLHLTSLATLFFVIATNLPAQEKDPRITTLIDTLHKTRTPMQAAISPEATLVAWSVRTPQGAQLHLTDITRPTPGNDKLIGPSNAAANCSSSQPTWSPAGESLAFLSTCATDTNNPHQTQVFLWSRRSNQIRQLTHLTGNIEDITWSPDGKAIGFLFVPNATRSAGALAAMKPWSGVVGEDGVEVQGVAVLTVANNNVVQVTPSNLHVYEFDWAPDSKRIAYVAANPPGENNWWVAQLYTQTIVATKSATTDPHSVLNTAHLAGPLHGLQIAVPKWSPDGKRIAFIGGIMSDQGSTGGDIYSIPATGGTPSNIMPDKSVSTAWFDWTSPSSIRYVAHRGGGYVISAYNVDSLNPLPDSGEAYQQSLSAGKDLLSLSRTGAYAFISSSYANPPEVFVSRGPTRNLIQVSHLNTDLKPTWGKAESIDWDNDGFKVQGWLLYPANYDPTKKYPMIVDVHGGPSAAVTPRWPSVGYGAVPFSALGYFVFMPNPRGSYGQGEKFTQANIKDFGYGDLSDILSGMDVLEKRLPIDKSREGLTGWSYGGFMTMFAVTQTPRFRAAVAGAGISDWKSYYGENSIDQWMVPLDRKSVV